jgi:cellulose synthase/poly-beta-1,6-N-acetylglucosamine synthase-like glycosyltransferase
MDREDTGDEEFRAMSDSSPVTLVNVEIGGRIEEVALLAKPGDRIWVEIVKHGQIVGVVERTAQGVGLPASAIEELANEYAGIEPSSLHSISDDLLPRATVVVPTIYRRVNDLAQTIESLLNLDYPDYEIILVDNRPGTDNPPIMEFSDSGRVRVELEPTKGASSARNRGIEVSSGDFIAFTDDDAIVERNWLRALGVKFAQEADVDVIGGMVRPTKLDTRAQLWFEEFYGGFTTSYLPRKWSIEIVGDSDPLFPYSAGHFGAGCNMAVRRTTFERYGGFDTRLGIGTKSKGAEDLMVFVKILLGGGIVAFEPAALVRHSHRRTSHDFMTQVFGYGTGYSAMLTSLILEDHRRFRAVLRRVPIGLRMLLFPTEQRSPSAASSYPRRTQIYQLLGMAYGPIAYLRSWVSSRRSA